jgi:hypothetical protein
MVARRLTRGALVVLLVAAPAVWYACSDRGLDNPAGPSITAPVILAPDFLKAVAAQRRYTDDLLAMPGVVGTAIARQPDGRVGMVVLLERPGIAGLPHELDGVPVAERVTGRLMAFSDPTARQRPAPLGLFGRPPGDHGRHHWRPRAGRAGTCVHPVQQSRPRQLEWR